MDFNVLYLGLVLINMAVLSVGMYYTFVRIESRGARPLFLFLFALLGFITMYFSSLLVRTPQSKEFMMYAGYGFILLLPIFWTLLVYEMAGEGIKNAWHFNLPFSILNLVAFSFFIINYPGMPKTMSYYSCELAGPMFNCQVTFSTMYYVALGLVAFELFGGIGWLLYSFFAQKHEEERSRYLFLVIAVGFGFIVVYVAGVAFPNTQNNFDPLPIALTLTTAMLLMATFSKRLLAIRIGVGPQLNRVEDMLLVVNNDHFIQDVNMSTLQFFGKEVQDFVNTQLETVLSDHPEIINLFTNTGITAEKLELEVGEEVHLFESTVSEVLDPETSIPSGQRLVLRDITNEKSTESAGTATTSTVVRDTLTNQYTRESFFQFGTKLLKSARRRQDTIALIVIDIDDFSNVNERYSHLVGDQGLIQMVEIINRMIRSTDLLARFKDDELVLLLPSADEFAAYQICSRIMEMIATHRFNFQAQEFQMTVSMGYTTCEFSEEYNLDQIVKIAYEALEQSHSLGRNRLTFLPVNMIEGN